MDSFILTCDVDGTPPIQYKWYKDNIIIDQTQSSNSLIMNKAMRLDKGNYRCVAINSAGLMKTKAILIKINCKQIIYGALCTICQNFFFNISQRITFSTKYSFSKCVQICSGFGQIN